MTPAADKTIIIYGSVKLPSIGATNNKIYVYTYGTQHNTNILTNGQNIDLIRAG